MRSGKTHLLDLARWTAGRGRRISGGSDAAIVRSLAKPSAGRSTGFAPAS